MDFRKEKYRKQKQQKANIKRPQKKKEVRLRVSDRCCLCDTAVLQILSLVDRPAANYV